MTKGFTNRFPVSKLNRKKDYKRTFEKPPPLKLRPNANQSRRGK